MTSIFVAAWNSISGVWAGGTPGADKNTFTVFEHIGKVGCGAACFAGSETENAMSVHDDCILRVDADSDDSEFVFKSIRTGKHDDAEDTFSAPVFRSVRFRHETIQIAHGDRCCGVGVIPSIRDMSCQNRGRGIPRSTLDDQKPGRDKDDRFLNDTACNDGLSGAAYCDEFVFCPRS